MRHLNYTHLLYFWTVSREGSVARAAEVLHLTPQTISGQLKKLEQAVGEPLLMRQGQGLALTETGHLVKEYADEIFEIGAELTQRLSNSDAFAPAVLRVGVVNAVPKLITQRVLSVAFAAEPPTRVICKEDRLEALLADLAVHRLDLVISDRPIPPGTHVKAFNHALGTSTVSFFAHRSIAGQFREFPEHLDQAPVLLPTSSVALRRELDEWFDSCGIAPHVVAEIDDSALLKAFGEGAVGAFPAPTAIGHEVCSMYHSRHLGVIEHIHETFYAISPERRVKHPMVLAITRSARDQLFAD